MKLLARPGAAADLPDKRVIGGGLRAVVFLDLVVDSQLTVPRSLRHRLAFKSSRAESAEEDLVEGGNVQVSRAVPILIGSPLRGGGWLAANGPSNDSEHRRSLIAVDGKARISQRFAIDWLKLGQDGQVASASPAKNPNWYSYGIEVLAVADAKVVAVKDEIPENDPLTEKYAVPITVETIAGNYVTLDLGHDRFALYASFAAQKYSRQNRRLRAPRPGSGTDWEFRKLRRSAPALSDHGCQLAAWRRRCSLRLRFLQCSG